MATAISPKWLSIVGWAVAGAVVWIAADTVDRRTDLNIFSDGGRLLVEAAGSELVAEVAVESVNRIEIRATDSVFPPGGEQLVVRRDGETVLTADLPARFHIPNSRVDPVGDWEIDDLSGAGLVWWRDVEVSGSFELAASFTGRPHQHLAVTLIGHPTVTVSFRRALINNDLFVWDARWQPVAVTSIDPTPAADLAAAAAILARAAAAASWLVALFLGLARLLPVTVDVRAISPPARFWLAAAMAAVLGASAGITSLRFADEALERLPHTPDSVVYLLQARWLSEGHLSGQVAEIQDHLDVPFTYVVGDRWLGHYPPGWPLALAAGLLAGAPWAVAPLLGAMYVVLVWWLGRLVADDAVGLVAAALATLSPMSRVIFGSHLSHAASSVLVVLFLCLLLIARRKQSLPLAAAAGCVVGLCLAVRPLVAVAAALPAGLLLLDDVRRGRSRRATAMLVAVTAGGLAGAVPTLWANLVITGSPLSLPYSLAEGSMYSTANIPFGLQNLDAILASTVPALHGWGWGLTRSPLMLALPLAIPWIPFLLRRANRNDLLLAGLVFGLAVVHLGTRAHGLHGFGPRYYFEAFAALYVLSGRGFQELARVAARAPGAGATTVAAWLLLAVLSLPAALVLPDRLGLYAGYNGVDGSLARAVESAGLQRAIVLFTDDDWRDWAMASRMMTDGEHDGLVFARSLDDNSTLWNAFPDLPVCAWTNGRLSPPSQPHEIRSQAFVSSP
jgi:hypothetical protein